MQTSLGSTSRIACRITAGRGGGGETGTSSPQTIDKNNKLGQYRLRDAKVWNRTLEHLSEESVAAYDLLESRFNASDNTT